MTQNGSPTPRRKGRLVLMALVAGVVAFGLVSLNRAADAEQELKLKSHLTLYVGEPLLSEGGTVIVASIPLPEDEWRALEGPNPAAEDPNNRKRPTLQPKDLLFGAVVRARTNFVEMYYPEGGTFGFDLVPIEGSPPNAKLTTRRILVGSGGWTHWDSGTAHKWPDVSTIFVEGHQARETDARIIRGSQSRIMNMGPPQFHYAAAVVHAPPPEMIREGTHGEVE